MQSNIINDIFSILIVTIGMTKFFPFELLKLKTGIAAGVAVLAMIGIVLVNIPDVLWYPMIQLPTFTLLLFVLANKFNHIHIFEKITEHGWIGALTGALIIVFVVNYITLFFGKSTNETFYGGSQAIGQTPFKDPIPLCPPKLNFNYELDTDTERETPACISDPNELTEEQRLDEIDIYIRDAQESIARVTGYLNTSSPDERWLSKKDMDDPNNRDLTK
jgi:hypothetical protein